MVGVVVKCGKLKLVLSFVLLMLVGFFCSVLGSGVICLVVFC